ncbi:MAG TPA: hypothetical protein VF188_07245 [Longimicrobiales bacterium]
MEARNSIWIRGLVAGFLAATVLVIWFLVVDLIAGRPFYTPAFLASSLVGRAEVEVSFGLVASYTVLHYLLFLAFGVAVTWLLSRAEVAPGFLLGIVLGFFFFDLLFYVGVAVTGVDVVRTLGWPVVLGGCVLAGIVLMGYLHLKGVVRRVSWRDVLRRHRVVREGLVAGLIGAGAVALWFLIFDALSGRILFTPAALGSALLRGARGVAQVDITAATVASYTLIHITSFLIVGIIAAAVVRGAEEQPPLLLGAILAFVTFEALFIGILAMFAEWILDTLGWWNIALGNLVAALAMGGYLLAEHPLLRREIRELSGPSIEEPV